MDTCLDVMGPLDVSHETRRKLADHASAGGDLRWSTEQDAGISNERVGEMLQLIVSLRELPVRIIKGDARRKTMASTKKDPVLVVLTANRGQ